MAKKRANGEGSIRKKPSGRWEGRYTQGIDPVTGRRKPFERIAACRSITRATTPQRSGAACGLKLTASPTSATTPPRAMRGSSSTTSSRPSVRSSLNNSRPSTSRECITT